MRDFKNSGVFNVNGDVNIGDGNSYGKLFIHCSNEELVREREFRYGNIVSVETGAPTSPVAGVVLSGKDGYSAVSFFDIAQGSRA